MIVGYNLISFAQVWFPLPNPYMYPFAVTHMNMQVHYHSLTIYERSDSAVLTEPHFPSEI